jgi:hypothetical protein
MGRIILVVLLCVGQIPVFGGIDDSASGGISSDPDNRGEQPAIGALGGSGKVTLGNAVPEYLRAYLVDEPIRLSWPKGAVRENLEGYFSPDPNLLNLEGIGLIIIGEGPDEDWGQSALKAAIGHRLYQAGILFFTEIADREKWRNAPGKPVLKVHVSFRRLKGEERFIYTVKTDLRKQVSPKGYPDVSYEKTIWGTDIYGLVSTPDLSKTLQAASLDQIDRFIRRCEENREAFQQFDEMRRQRETSK